MMDKDEIERLRSLGLSDEAIREEADRRLREQLARLPPVEEGQEDIGQKGTPEEETGGAQTVGPAVGYPIAYDVPYPEKLGRLSTAFRAILAIPQVLIVGGPGVGYGATSQTGLFGAVVAITSMISWFAIVFTGRYPRGLWDMAMMYMRWRANVVTYVALLRDEYPPFGEGDYSAVFDVPYPEVSNRWTVVLRLILVIPHVVVLFFVTLIWLATAIIAWFAILFTGRYPEGLFRFGVGTLRWTLRVQAYIYLMRDEYPPFSLYP